MYWATLSRPIPLAELGWANAIYLGNGISGSDPMMIWGTTVDIDPVDDFVKEYSRRIGLIVSPAHLLVWAVAVSLSQHPKVNCRVIGRRVYRYDGVNVVVPMLRGRSGEAETVFLHRADKMSLSEIARRFWREARDMASQAASDERECRDAGGAARHGLGFARRFRLWWLCRMSWLGFAVANRFRFPTIWPWQQELDGANAFVNYLGFAGAPPLICFKPSCLPMNSYSVNVTLGPAEPRPVVVDGAIVIRRQAPLFVRADHRMVNAHDAAAFISTLRAHLADPSALVARDEPSRDGTADHAGPACDRSPRPIELTRA